MAKTQRLSRAALLPGELQVTATCGVNEKVGQALELLCVFQVRLLLLTNAVFLVVFGAKNGDS